MTEDCGRPTSALHHVLGNRFFNFLKSPSEDLLSLLCGGQSLVGIPNIKSKKVMIERHIRALL